MEQERHPGWPTQLTHGDVLLRPVRRADFAAWREVRLRNADWLARWEPTSPMAWPARHTRASFRWMRRQMRRSASDGLAMPFMVFVDDVLVGQVNLGPIARAPVHSADVGYWIDQRFAGRGIVPRAVALVTRHALTHGQLHRVGAVIQPHNAASLRVVRKLGFREEGLLSKYLDIDGAWRDHIGFALTREDDRSALNTILAY